MSNMRVNEMEAIQYSPIHVFDIIIISSIIIINIIIIISIIIMGASYWAWSYDQWPLKWEITIHVIIITEKVIVCIHS